MKPKTNKVVIDRGEWLEGAACTNMGEGQMWRPDIKRGCCLGHLGIQAYGVKKSKISNYALPRMDNSARRVDPVYPIEEEFSDRASEINDNRKMAKKAKEARLTKLFKDWGFNLSFKGDYKKVKL